MSATAYRVPAYDYWGNDRAPIRPHVPAYDATDALVAPIMQPIPDGWVVVISGGILDGVYTGYDATHDRA